MKEAIFGCMGGEPKSNKECVRGINSKGKGKSDRTPVYQRISHVEDNNRGFATFHQGSRRSDRPRTHTDYSPAIIRQLSKATRPGYQARQRSPLSRSRRPSSLDFLASQSGDARFRLQPSRAVTGRYRSPQGQGHYIREDQGSYESDVKEFERQYRRDLIIRQAAKLPLWEYTYEDGKPIRGILKNPKFIRRPGLDEICYLEVIVLCRFCMQLKFCYLLNILIMNLFMFISFDSFSCEA